MYRQEKDILLNTFLIKKKRYRILLNFDTIIWERETKSKQNDKTTIPVSDIISVKQSKNVTGRQVEESYENNGSPLQGEPDTDMPTVSSGQPKNEFITIHYAKRVIKSSEDCNRWQQRKVVLQSNDPRIVSQWFCVLNKILNEQHRLRNVLVFINPFGGQKRGLETYEKFCKPLFQLANIDASCIISQRANQIHDIVMTHNLDQYDAICCVGGDGTFAEVVNGLIFRTMKDLNLDFLKPRYIPKPKIPVAVIPAGSTDTVAFSLHGTHDVLTAAIHMVLGQKRGLDICSVQNQNGLIRFCASVMSYGYLGDIALESEKYRWMGTKRYEYAGLKNILTNTSYPAEIRILLSNADVNNTSSSLSEQNINRSVSSIQELNDEKCFVNCQRCSSSSFLANEVYKVHDTNQQYEEQDEDAKKLFKGASSSKSTEDIDKQYYESVNREQSIKHDNISCDNSNKNESNSNLCVIDKVRSNSYNPIGETAVPHQPNQLVWKAIKGGFFMISGANITCACSRSPNGMSKYCHLGDGSIDLILVHKTTFLNNIRLLIKLANKTGDIRDFPFVEVYRTKQFYFRAHQYEDVALDGSCQPINMEKQAPTSQWNCDGEIVPDLEIFMSSHCQLLDVFMRGPYPFNEEIPHKVCCPGFCKP